MKKFYLSVVLAICALLAQAQNNAANYAFSTITTGSLTDMSSGTTLLIPADQDDLPSALTNFGFDFYFMGARYTQFTVNTNGSILLGATISNTLYDPLGQAGQALITAYGADQRTHAGNGKIHYKLTGAAPNRVFTIEWLNMQSDFNPGGTADLTYQVRLYETTGVIEFAYGSMALSAAGAADPNSASPQFGFSSNNSVGTIGSIIAAQSGAFTPTFSSASATPVNNSFSAGTIPVLTSAANGSRRIFTLTPPLPNAAGGPLNFTGVGTTTTTLNWTDASNETGYAIYQSLNGANYNYFGSAAQNAGSFNATGLLSNTNYFWQVYSVSEGALSSAIAASRATIPPANIVKSVGTGLWSSPGTWSTGAVPSADDSVVISNSNTVTIDMAATVYALTVGDGGAAVLQFEANTARTLTVNSNVLIQAGATFQSNPAGNQNTHILSVAGNLVNNGTLDFSTNANTAGVNLTFTGLFNATFSGTGSTTDVRFITINKGTSSASVLEITVANFTVRGVTTDTVVGGFLVLTNGTFKISGSFTITSRVFPAPAYNIPATAGVWLNNPNVTIAGQNGNAINNGLFRISSGNWNIGTTNLNSSFNGAAAAMFIIEGGTVNVAGRFDPSTAVVYNQSAGNFNVAVAGNSFNSVGSFSLPDAATFIFTGGTISIVQAGTASAVPIDYNNLAPSISSGGTLQIGTGATATNFNFRLRGNIPNVVIDNTTNNKTATATALITLYGTTLIKPGAALVINGQTCRVRGSVFTNNGTLTGTTASSRFYFLGGSGPTTYTGTGIVTAPLTSFEADNVAGVTLDPAISQMIVARINNFSGGIINANKITLGNGGATSGIIQLGVAGASQTVNGLDVPPVFNPGTGGINILYGPELTGRTTGTEMPPSRMLNQLNISNTNPVTIAGGDVATNMLIMSGGNIITGSNTLTLGTSAAAAGTYTYTSGTIVGKFKRWIAAAAGNSDFPVGIAAAKRNASVNFTTPPSTGGTLTAQWVSANPGLNGLPLTEGSIAVTTASSEGYWSVVAGDGLAGGAYTGTFTATAIPNVTDISQLVLLKRPNSASPWALDGIHLTTTGTPAVPVLSRTGMVGFSEFGIGSSAVNVLPVTLLNFSGHRNANDNILNWNTAGEQNNVGFEVQRSANGTDYKKIGFVQTLAPAGNSTATLYYSFTDSKPDGLIQYYRLKQINTDNEFKYSSIVILKQDKPLLFTINSIYPNPVSATASLNISSKVNDKINLVITDMNGRKLSEQTAVIAAGNNSVSVDVNKLPAGAYMITASCTSGSCGNTSASFIKH
jgi:hypothetical protein